MSHSLDKKGRESHDGGSSEPPDDGNMEARVAKLESIAEKTGERLVSLEQSVAVILSNYVTKEDLHKELHSMTWRIFGFAGLLTAAVYFIARYIH